MTDWVFPEDSGTGASEGDWTDAANWASAFYTLGFTDFVASGLGFTYNSAGPSLDIAGGKAVLTATSANTRDHSGDGSRGVETRSNGVSFVVEADAQTGLSLSASSVNHIFMDVDLSTDDSVSYHIDTDDTAPSSPSLKIGEVDTSTDTVTEINRSPDLHTESFSADKGWGFQQSNHHTSYDTGLSNEEISRYELEADEKLEVWRVALPKKGGGAEDANVSLRIQDSSAATTLASTNANTVSRGDGSPLGTSGAGASVLVQISNSSGSSVDVAPDWRVAVVRA